MLRLTLAITITLASQLAHAGLLDATIQAGSNKGASLFAVVSQSVPERPLKEAFAFFDQNQGLKRTSLIYSMRPKTTDSKVSVYDCKGFDCKTETIQQTLFANSRYMVIFDLTQSSMTQRLHIVDLGTGEVTSLFASHGKESTCANDPSRACQFVSDRDSEATPLGFFVTGPTNFGEVGWAIPLFGLQGGSTQAVRNDVPSTIVIHGATYASPDFRRTHGYMGRSHGCPALDFKDIKAWKDRLQSGALFYFYHSMLPTEPAPVSNVAR